VGNKELDTKYVHFELSDNILLGTYKSGSEITVEVAKEMVESRLEISKGKSYPLLIDGRELKSIDKESRDYFSSEKGRRGIAAVALLAGSVFTSFIGNFFLKISYDKPTFPTRLFTEESTALKWLEQFKD